MLTKNNFLIFILLISLFMNLVFFIKITNNSKEDTFKEISSKDEEINLLHKATNDQKQESTKDLPSKNIPKQNEVASETINYPGQEPIHNNDTSRFLETTPANSSPSQINAAEKNAKLKEDQTASIIEQ